MRLPTRVTFLFALMVLAGIGLGSRFVYWQVFRYQDLSKLALAERERTFTIPAKRGDILTGDGFLVATDVFVYQVAAHPAVMKDAVKPQIASFLSPLLGIPQGKLIELLNQKDQTVMLTLQAPSQIGPQLDALRAEEKIPGIDFVAMPRRTYPGNSFMAHVLGFVNAERKGAYGVEQFYNTELTGKDGVKKIIADVAGDDPLPFDLPTGTEVQNGASLELTIHSGIQNIAERELTRAVISNGATSGSVVILDARTGAIRAMANYPTANLNQYGQTPLSLYNNASLSQEYEPGSVFKVVTLSCALDYGVVNMNSSFNDTGSVTIGGRSIYNHDFLKPGIVDLVTVMRQSLNVEAARMALLMGANRFYDCVKRFGFGTSARVDMASETGGTLKLPGDGRWYEADLGTNAFGQGIAATPLQMASALLVIANDGVWVQPHVVERKIYPDGKVEAYQMKGSRQTIRPETARLAAQILTRSIAAESTNLAVVPGYKITGKTGTSQIPVPGGYHPTDTIASFGGYFPADDPRYIILVKIDRPKRSPWGSQVASPVFAAIAQQVAALMALPPDAERVSAK